MDGTDVGDGTAVRNGSDADGANLVEGVDVDAVALAASGCPSVSAVGAGAVAQTVATLLPGRRVAGVQVADGAVTVEIRLRWGVPVTTAAAELRTALRGLLAGHRLDVDVADIDDPPAPAALTEASPTTDESMS